MLFRSRRRTPTRREQWRDFARRLELEDAQTQEARLREWLDLGERPLAPLYGLRRSGQPTLFVFDHERARSGPTGTVTTLATGILLRASAPLAAASLRAQARRNPVLESIEAGRTGSRRLSFDELPDFDQDVSVFARDEAAARAWLTRPVQYVLQRMLVRRGVTPVLVVGHRHMLVLCEGPEPAPFESVEALATDLFTLFAMVEGTVGGGPAGAGEGTARPEA
ncbi:MAG: hypothetical protein P8Y02_06405 [Deinococcales bacterium]